MGRAVPSQCQLVLGNDLVAPRAAAQLCEHHTTVGRLVHAQDRARADLTNQVSATIDHHHAPIIQVADALVGLFAHFLDGDVDGLPGPQYSYLT